MSYKKRNVDNRAFHFYNVIYIANVCMNAYVHVGMYYYIHTYIHVCIYVIIKV